MENYFAQIDREYTPTLENIKEDCSLTDGEIRGIQEIYFGLLSPGVSPSKIFDRFKENPGGEQILRKWEQVRNYVVSCLGKTPFFSLNNECLFGRMLGVSDRRISVERETGFETYFLAKNEKGKYRFKTPQREYGGSFAQGTGWVTNNFKNGCRSLLYLVDVENEIASQIRENLKDKPHVQVEEKSHEDFNL